jgi:hypothetical protein
MIQLDTVRVEDSIEKELSNIVPNSIGAAPIINGNGVISHYLTQLLAVVR